MTSFFKYSTVFNCPISNQYLCSHDFSPGGFSAPLEFFISSALCHSYGISMLPVIIISYRRTYWNNKMLLVLFYWKYPCITSAIRCTISTARLAQCHGYDSRTVHFVPCGNRTKNDVQVVAQVWVFVYVCLMFVNTYPRYRRN